MNETFSADSPERTKQVAMERVKQLLPNLREIHDTFEDRSIMFGDGEIASYLASQFTTSGIEVFEDFAKQLREAKDRQLEEKSL